MYRLDVGKGEGEENPADAGETSINAQQILSGQANKFIL